MNNNEISTYQPNFPSQHVNVGAPEGGVNTEQSTFTEVILF